MTDDNNGISDYKEYEDGYNQAKKCLASAAEVLERETSAKEDRRKGIMDAIEDFYQDMRKHLEHNY